MPDKEVLLTPDGLRKLEEELNDLKTNRRKQIAERIKSAIELGDLSENSEYHDAKNEQAFIEARIGTIEKTLRNARVVESVGDSSRVTLGSKVTLLDMNTQDEVTYTIVGSTETDPLAGRISNESPIGAALIDRKAGEVIEVTVPAGTIKLKVSKIQ